MDDHDFTAFLYYSNFKKIYVIQKDGGKAGEWWILSYDDFSPFLATHPNTWIVTPNVNDLPKLTSFNLEETKSGYQLLKSHP